MNDAERFEQIFLSQVVRPGADKLLEWLKSTDFFTAPASTRFHGAYPGGLVKHSLNVYYALLGNFNLRGLYSPQTQAIVALLHDVCKANYYAGEYPDYTVKDQMPMGHGEKSVYLVMKHMELTDDEALAIRWHMGAYDDAFRGGSRALNAAMERTPLVLELSDLPPRYRAQAEAQLARRGKKRGDTMTAAARAAAMSGLKFDSRGEYEYYVGTVAPKVGRGEIVKWEAHPCFLLFPAGEYNGVKLRSVQYTADFRLTYADGTVEIVEIKSKFVRRMQRDYPVRRRVFMELIARPAGWKFTEIITAEDKEEIKRWRELAEEVSSCGKNG